MKRSRTVVVSSLGIAAAGWLAGCGDDDDQTAYCTDAQGNIVDNSVANTSESPTEVTPLSTSAHDIDDMYEVLDQIQPAHPASPLSSIDESSASMAVELDDKVFAKAMLATRGETIPPSPILNLRNLTPTASSPAPRSSPGFYQDDEEEEEEADTTLVISQLTPQSQSSSSQLSTGAKAGISVGAVLAGALLAGIGFFLFRILRRKRTSVNDTPEENGSSKPELPGESSVPITSAAPELDSQAEIKEMNGDSVPELMSPVNRAELEAPHEVHEMPGSASEKQP